MEPNFLFFHFSSEGTRIKLSTIFCGSVRLIASYEGKQGRQTIRYEQKHGRQTVRYEGRL